MLTLIALKGEEGKAIGKQRKHYFFHTLGSAGDEEGKMGGGGFGSFGSQSQRA